MRTESTERECITSREMRALELNAEYFEIPRLLLMENAGHCAASEIAARFKHTKTVAILCGLGGNGGDGFVIARHLSSLGFKVAVFLAGKAKDISDKAALQNWASLQPLTETVLLHEIYDSTLTQEMQADIVVDALLGIGIKGKIRAPILQLVKQINNTNAFRVAIDIPTGIDADTGEVLGEAVKADLTITFHKAKKGLERARKYVGELVVGNIGLPTELEKLAGPGDVLSIARIRPTESHKGDFGRLLVIGGSETFSGAPALVALAGMRTGVDLVYVAAPEKTAQAIASMSPDLITVKLRGHHLNPDNVPELKEYVKKSDAVVLGPGLGLHPETQKAVEALVGLIEDSGTPLLLDADGLKAFAAFKRRLKVPLVLTPHAGEYVILTSAKLPDRLWERVEEVRRSARELRATVLLKGATDIICDDSRCKLNLTGNPGMTVGGTGDVLSGIVGALLAQDVEPFEAAVVGAFVNGAAGDFVSEEKGHHMVASDLVDWIPRVLNDPMSYLKVQRSSARAR